MTPRLFYMPRTRSSRILWLLEEIGTDYEPVEITGAQRRSEEHLRRHPLGRVPALELDDGTTMFESAAICLQLADRYPDAGLIGPLGSAQRALAYQWVLFSVAELEGPLFTWLAGLRDDTPAPTAQSRFADAAGVLEIALSDDEWLIGDRFGVADVMCASVLQGAAARGLLDPWPAVAAYVTRGEARPACVRAAALSDRPRS